LIKSLSFCLQDDYDSYDDTELGASQTQKGESDPTSLPTEERQISPEENTTVQLSSTEPSSPNHQIDLIEANHEQTTGEEILESSSPTLLSSLPTEMISPYKLMSYADISVSEDATLIMPPPLHPAPLSVSRANQVKPVYSRNLDSPICSPIPVTYPHSECTRSPSYSPSSIQNHDNNHDNGLNTPLGSLMPVEYANVDIKELFPSYDPGKIPLWGRLFRLPHPLGIYHEYIERYEYMEEMLSHRLSRSDRWEIIDMVRFTSTERAKQGEEEGSAKFARGNRLSMSEQIRCYKEECQRIFDLQNRVLSNPELLSSDEEMSSEDDEDEVTGADGVGHRSTGLGGHSSSGPSNSIGGVRLSSLSSSARSYAQVSRNMESLMSNRMTSKELDSKGDDKDRSKLKRALEGSDSLPGTKRPRKTNQLQLKEADISSTECNEGSTTGNTVYEASATAAGTILDLQPPWPNANKKMLRIMRTYSEDGHQYTRTELVPWSPVVEIYLKIRQTRDDEFIHNFVDSDDHFREQQKKEKRRLQVLLKCYSSLLYI
ncbi:unnamed protein product, partial [Trichobilharzia regenti]